MLNRRTISLLSLLLATACAKPRQEQATPSTASDCYSCHGSTENGNPAPPPMINQPSLADVHQSHLQPSTWHAPVA